MKFVQILQYLRQFWRYKMVDRILKISRPGVFDIRCLSWNTAIIVFMKKCRMDRRRYKSRHWIPMFIGIPCFMSSCRRHTMYCRMYTARECFFLYIIIYLLYWLLIFTSFDTPNAVHISDVQYTYTNNLQKFTMEQIMPLNVLSTPIPFGIRNGIIWTGPELEPCYRFREPLFLEKGLNKFCSDVSEVSSFNSKSFIRWNDKTRFWK